MIVLSYPIVITLERPVRFTPEQAVNDYYSALSHHFPHYRRMWLLLSTAGRTSASFASFEGFKGYWKAGSTSSEGDARANPRRSSFRWSISSRKERGADVDRRSSTPFKFDPRASRPQGTVESVRVQTSLVRGPDRMWYLDDGTLPTSRG